MVKEYVVKADARTILSGDVLTLLSNGGVYQDAGTVAADGNNEITVLPFRRYTLTASDIIAGVIGLDDGQSIQVQGPATGSTTLEDSGSLTAGLAFALSGSDQEITSDDDSLYTLIRIGSEIRVAGGGGSGISAVASLAALKNEIARKDGDMRVVLGSAGGMFVWDSTAKPMNKQSGSDGAMTAQDDQFVAASASFLAGRDEDKFATSGSDPKFIEVSGANWNGEVLRGVINRVDSATEVEIRTIVARTTVSNANWVLKSQASPLSWETEGQEAVFIPPAGTEGEAGLWKRVQFIETGEIRTEWFGAVGDGNSTSVADETPTDDYAAIMRAFDFMARYYVSPLYEVKRPPMIFRGGGHYYTSQQINIPLDMEWFSICGQPGQSATIYSDQPGMAIFSVGPYRDAKEVTTPFDLLGDFITNHPTFENLVIKTKATSSPKSNPTSGLRLCNVLNAKIINCQLNEFNIHLDCYRAKFDKVSGVRMLSNERVNGLNATLAWIRLDGIYDTTASTNAKVGGGNHWHQMEFQGNSADYAAVENVMLVHAVDGMYVNSFHAQYFDDGIKYDVPAGENQNNGMVTQLYHQVYMDDHDGDGFVITGTMDSDLRFCKQWSFNQCFWRTGRFGFYCHVADTGFHSPEGVAEAAARKFLGNFMFNGCEFSGLNQACINISGPNQGAYIAPVGVQVMNSFFGDNNRSDVATSAIFAEALNIKIDGNTFDQDYNFPTRLIRLYTNSTGGESRAVQITNNDMSQAKYDNQIPWLYDNDRIADLVINNNVLKNIGENVDQDLFATTTADQSAVIWSRAINTDSCYGRLRADVVGMSRQGSAGNPARCSAEIDLGCFKDDTVTDPLVIVDYGDGKEQKFLRSVITQNEAPVVATMLTGPAHDAADVDPGDVVTAGGNVYIVVDGSGTLTSAPTVTGQASEVINSIRVMHVQAEAATTLALVVSGGGTAKIDWSARIKWKMIQEKDL